MKASYCCQCGTPRRFGEAQITSYCANAGIIHTLDYRQKATNPEASNEDCPQLLASACVYRNGGTSEYDTHICPACLAVGLRKLKAIIDRDLAAIDALPGGAQ
jgi:hypothetical protein